VIQNLPSIYQTPQNTHTHKNETKIIIGIIKKTEKSLEEIVLSHTHMQPCRHAHRLTSIIKQGSLGCLTVSFLICFWKSAYRYWKLNFSKRNFPKGEKIWKKKDEKFCNILTQFMS
jgi:hypothetical protein